MPTCPICTNLLPEGAVFCARCGWLEGAPDNAAQSGSGPSPVPPPSPGQPRSGPPGYGTQGYGVAAPPAPYGTGGWGPYPIQPPRKVNGLAIAALCTSIGAVLFTFTCGIGIIAGPVGAILGHVSLGQIKRSGEEGRGLALAGVIIGWALTALAAAVIVLFTVVAVSG